jgi:hypothetical protein
MIDPSIISALISAGSYLFAGGMQNYSIGKQERKAERLAMLAREDQQKEADRQYGLASEGLDLQKLSQAYDRKIKRETMNKSQVSLFGNTLSRLFKNNATTQNWIMSLYGAPVKGMG